MAAGLSVAHNGEGRNGGYIYESGGQQQVTSEHLLAPVVVAVAVVVERERKSRLAFQSLLHGLGIFVSLLFGSVIPYPNTHQHHPQQHRRSPFPQ